MKYFVIISAGGSGERMNSPLPKQFHTLQRSLIDIENFEIVRENKLILHWTIEQFLNLKQQVEIILVLPKKWISHWQKYYLNNNLDFAHTIVEGGLTRFHSVKEALKKVPDDAIVAIHDGVRPFASKNFIERMLDESLDDKMVGAIPYIHTFDSLREVVKCADEVVKDANNEDISLSQYVDRGKYFMIQTPQVFLSTPLKEAYQHPYSLSFTDDASVVEAAGYKIKLVEGERLNIKITNEDDKKAAQIILNGLSSNQI